MSEFFTSVLFSCVGSDAQAQEAIVAAEKHHYAVGDVGLEVGDQVENPDDPSTPLVQWTGTFSFRYGTARGNGNDQRVIKRNWEQEMQEATDEILQRAGMSEIAILNEDNDRAYDMLNEKLNEMIGKIKGRISGMEWEGSTRTGPLYNQLHDLQRLRKDLLGLDENE